MLYVHSVIPLMILNCYLRFKCTMFLKFHYYSCIIIVIMTAELLEVKSYITHYCCI